MGSENTTSSLNWTQELFLPYSLYVLIRHDCQWNLRLDTVTAFDIRGGCTCVLQTWIVTIVPSSPLSPCVRACVRACTRARACVRACVCACVRVCVCVCVCVCVFRCERPRKPYRWKCLKTAARYEISVLEEVNMLLVSAFVFNAVWRFRPEFMGMADFIDSGSEFRCSQH